MAKIYKINGGVKYEHDNKSIQQLVIENKKDLSFCNLSNLDLSSCDLSNSNLFSSDLSNSDLSYSNLFNSNLSYSNLSSCNLSESNLSKADLYFCNLSACDLSESDLSYSNLSYSNLSACDLSDTQFTSCNLSSCNLSEIKYYSESHDIFNELCRRNYKKFNNEKLGIIYKISQLRLCWQTIMMKFKWDDITNIFEILSDNGYDEYLIKWDLVTE